MKKGGTVFLLIRSLSKGFLFRLLWEIKINLKMAIAFAKNSINEKTIYY